MRKFLFLICIGWGVLLTFSGCSTYSKAVVKQPNAVAATPEQREILNSLRQFSDQPLVQIGRYLDLAEGAGARLARDQSDSLAQSDYNFAVARIVGIIEENNLEPWSAPLSCPSAKGTAWQLNLPPPDPRPEYHPSHFEIVPADTFDFRGELVGDRTVKPGLGAPTVVIGEDIDFTKADEFAQGKKVFYGLTAVIDFDESICTLRLHDPLNEETVMFNGRSYALAGDFQAPLAMSLAELNLKKVELAGFFKPDQFNNSARLARLQPYDPNKIPLIFIHGLGDSPATFVPVIDSLRADPTFRKNYQVLVFAYPSGIAYPMMTAALRYRMDLFNEQYRGHKDFVLVGHSMGGMIARLLISENGTTLWDAYYDKPPEEIPFSEWPRTVMTKSLIFEPREDVGKVIFVSASHRGSYHATNTLGRLGAKLIGDPIADQSVTEEAYKYARPEVVSQDRDHLPNSVEVLDPDSPFLALVDSLPLKSDIPFHSIMGDRGKGGNLNRTKPQSSDGIVPYWSSQMEGAESELIVPSDHWSHLHPQGKSEIRRILNQYAESQ